MSLAKGDMRASQGGWPGLCKATIMAVACLMCSMMPAWAQGVHIAVMPETLTVALGQDFDLEIQVTAAGSPFNAYDAVVIHDSGALTFLPASPTTLQEGSYMVGACGETFHHFSEQGDSLIITHVLLCNELSVTGPGQLYRLRFRAPQVAGVTSVALAPAVFYNAGLIVSPVFQSDAVVFIGVSPTASLNVTIAGNGSVEKTPDQSLYAYGSSVTLSAVADPGYRFTGWSGDASGVENPLELTMDGDKNVTATFVEATAPTVEVISPNGAEALVVNSEIQIQWIATDNIGVTTIDLLISRNGADGPFETIALGVGNTGSLPWIVTTPVTDSAYVMAVAHDAAGNDGSDISDSAFAIVPPATAVEGERVTQFALAPVFPNPTEGPMCVRFDLPRHASVRIDLLDVQGREVARLEDGMRPPGHHQVVWNARACFGRLTPGIYTLRLQADEESLARHVVLLR